MASALIVVQVFVYSSVHFNWGFIAVSHNFIPSIIYWWEFFVFRRDVRFPDLLVFILVFFLIRWWIWRMCSNWFWGYRLLLFIIMDPYYWFRNTYYVKICYRLFLFGRCQLWLFLIFVNLYWLIRNHTLALLCQYNGLVPVQRLKTITEIFITISITVWKRSTSLLLYMYVLIIDITKLIGLTNNFHYILLFWILIKLLLIKFVKLNHLRLWFISNRCCKYLGSKFIIHLHLWFEFVVSLVSALR